MDITFPMSVSVNEIAKKVKYLNHPSNLLSLTIQKPTITAIKLVLDSKMSIYKSDRIIIISKTIILFPKYMKITKLIRLSPDD